MPNLLIDAGNTFIKCAVSDPSGLLEIRSFTGWNEEAISAWLEGFPGIVHCLACSTRQVPPSIPSLFGKLGIRFVELTHRIPLPITIGYETPETLGKDRIAAVAGALDRFPGRNVVVIDAGTALTIDLATTGKTFLGGNISPGLRMRFAALHRQTYSLPEVEPSEEVPLIGTNTRQAILAGVVNGMVYEIEQTIAAIHNKYPDPAVILTGGDARYLSAHLRNTIFVEENLVLNGLNAILRHFSDNR